MINNEWRQDSKGKKGGKEKEKTAKEKEDAKRNIVKRKKEKKERMAKGNVELKNKNYYLFNEIKEKASYRNDN